MGPERGGIVHMTQTETETETQTQTQTDRTSARLAAMADSLRAVEVRVMDCEADLGQRRGGVEALAHRLGLVEARLAVAESLLAKHEEARLNMAEAKRAAFRAEGFVDRVCVEFGHLRARVDVLERTLEDLAASGAVIGTKDHASAGGDAKAPHADAPSAPPLSGASRQWLLEQVERSVVQGLALHDCDRVASLLLIEQQLPRVGEVVARLLAVGRHLEMLADDLPAYAYQARVSGWRIGRENACGPFSPEGRLRERWRRFDAGELDLDCDAVTLESVWPVAGGSAGPAGPAAKAVG